MTDILKGNFETKNTVTKQDDGEDSLETRFEKSAMKRLGGSIAFVRKKDVLWGDDTGSDG